MSDTITAVVDTQTGAFVADGHEPDARYVVVTVPRNPDHVREKWDGAQIVAKTAQELADAATAHVDAVAAKEFDAVRAIKASVLVAEANRLNKTLAQLTAGEIAAVRTKWINAYKALNGGS